MSWQIGNPSAQRKPKSPLSADHQKKKVAEDAYNAGLKMIPDAKESTIHGETHGSVIRDAPPD
jgi:hypothetical protein